MNGLRTQSGKSSGRAAGNKKGQCELPRKKAIVIYDHALVTVEQMNKALLKVGCVAALKENYEENIVTRLMNRLTQVITKTPV